MELRELTEVDIVKLKLLYSITPSSFYRYYIEVIEDGGISSIYCSTGKVDYKYILLIGISSDVLVGLHSETSNMHIISKYGVFETEINCEIPSIEPVGELLRISKLHWEQQYLINTKGKSIKVGTEFKKLIHLGNNQYGLLKTRNSYKFDNTLMIKVFDEELNVIAENIVIDNKFEREYGLNLGELYSVRQEFILSKAIKNK